MKINRSNLIVIFALVCLISFAFAQTDKPDPITTNLIKAKASFARPDSVLFYSQKAYELASQSEDKRLKADAAKMMGVASHVNSKFDEAIPYYKESLNLFQKLNDTLETGKAYLNLATTYNARFDYQQTLKFALLSLDKFKQANNPNGEGRAYNLLAIIYNNQRKYRDALNYFKEYAELVSAAKDSVEIATAYNNIGATYHAFKMPDSAIYFLNASMRIHNKIGLSIRTGSAYQNLADIYLEQNQLEKALNNYRLANSIHKENKDVKLQAQTLLKIGEIEFKKKNYTLSEANLNRAIALASDVKDTEVLSAAYSSLAESEAAQGKFSSAYAHLQSSFAFRDSLNEAQNNAMVQELQAKYETERREQKIRDLNQKADIQKLEIAQRNLLLVIAIVLICTLVIISYFINRQRKQKERRLLLEQELETERLKIEAERKLNAEKSRISKELHDNIGSYLTFIHSIVDNDEIRASASEGKIDQLKDLTGETIRELRKTVWLINRNDVSLDEFGVKLREFFKTASQVSLQLSGNLSLKLQAHQVTELFRIIQEAVNNAVKHSTASHIDVRLSSENSDKLIIIIKDNGEGFDLQTESIGFGLNNMKTRAGALNAEIKLSSGSDGTLIELILPIQ